MSQAETKAIREDHDHGTVGIELGLKRQENLKMKNTYLLVLATLFFSACTTMNQTPAVPAKNQNTSKSVQFDLLDNRMFVKVMINGQGPFRFVFDTGGRNCLTPEVAKQLNLPMKPIEDAAGAGEQTVKAWRVQTNSFQIGDITLSSQEFMVLDFSPIKKAFALPAFDGIFGYEFLQKFSAQIDFVGSRISFLSIGPLQSVGFSSIPFDLVSDKPVISAKINDLNAKVLIDTGDRSALTIFSNFRSQKAIQRAFDGRSPQITGYGIGGPIPAILSQVDSLEIGAQAKLKNVVTRSPVTQGGFNAIANINASIGNEILKQFDVIFDYQKKLLYLRPNKFYGEDTRFVPVPVL